MKINDIYAFALINEYKALFKLPVKNSLNNTINKQIDTSFSVDISLSSVIHSVKCDLTYVNSTYCRITYKSSTNIDLSGLIYWALIDNYFVVFVKNIFNQNAEIYCNILNTRCVDGLIMLNGKFFDTNNVELHSGENLSKLIGQGDIGINYFYAQEVGALESFHKIDNYSTGSKHYFNVFYRNSSNGHISYYEGCIINQHLYKLSLGQFDELEISLVDDTIKIININNYDFVKVEIKKSN